MYSLDRRYLARHLYSLLPSVRKTALLLQVSPATISRWLRHPHRKIYTFSKIPLSKSRVGHAVKTIVVLVLTLIIISGVISRCQIRTMTSTLS